MIFGSLSLRRLEATDEILEATPFSFNSPITSAVSSNKSNLYGEEEPTVGVSGGSGFS